MMKTTKAKMESFESKKIAMATTIIGGGPIERDKVKIPPNQGDKH
jgi:hypothetical protein